MKKIISTIVLCLGVAALPFAANANSLNQVEQMFQPLASAGPCTVKATDPTTGALNKQTFCDCYMNSPAPAGAIPECQLIQADAAWPSTLKSPCNAKALDGKLSQNVTARGGADGACKYEIGLIGKFGTDSMKKNPPNEADCAADTATLESIKYAC